MPFEIQYTSEAGEHLGALSARERRIIADAVREQLAHQPNVPTRNRKPMRPNKLATWALRIGSFRVYYDVEEQPRRKVVVIAVGVKERNVVRIAGKEFPL